MKEPTWTQLPAERIGIIDLAEQIATTAHQSQVDKAGQPYVLHALRVAARAKHLCQEEAPQLSGVVVPAALLHDVLEDTSMTTTDLLAAGIPEDVVNTVVAVTKCAGEDPDIYAKRVASSPAAVLVKRADLDDNSDPERLALLDEETRNRLEAKYLGFRERLSKAMESPDGDQLTTSSRQSKTPTSVRTPAHL